MPDGRLLGRKNGRGCVRDQAFATHRAQRWKYRVAGVLATR